MTERLTAFPSHEQRRLGTGVDTRRRIMHVDMDAFFAALEQRVNPRLQNRPVIVGTTPERRGVVSTASYETRVYGVASGMSSAEARRLCPQAVFVEVDSAHYVFVSSRLLSIFEEYSPTVEAVSVDEAFLDVTGCGERFGGEDRLAQSLKERIRSELSLTCSVGIAPNKIMAKLASSVFKPDGLTVIRPEDIATILHPLPVGRLWGIGPVAQRELEAMGIATIGELAGADGRLMKSRFGKNGELMVRLARGEDESPVLAPDDQPDEKSVGHERTFPRDTNDPDFLTATLYHLSDLVGRRLRRLGFRGRTITIKYRHADFGTHSRQSTLACHSDLTRQIFVSAVRLFNRNWDRRRKIRLLGVSMSHLIPDDSQSVQGDFFTEGLKTISDPARIDAVVDQIRKRFGEASIWGAYSHLGLWD